jgi:glutamate 5-kinase
MLCLVQDKKENNMKTTIIKIGSSVLVNDSGEVKQGVVKNILTSVHKRIEQGENILIVSSGAVAIGSQINKQEKLTKRLAAGIGQMHLMSAYLSGAKDLGLKVSELLLSRPHLVERSHFLQLQESIQSAFDNKIILIVNENDALVHGTDWGFPDNDSLAASLSIALDVDKLILLSHVDGLYDSDPTQNKNAKLIEEIKDVNAPLMEFCGTRSSEQGRGGMVTKLKAARLCSAVGIDVNIVNGQKDNSLEKTLQGEKVGTKFLARKKIDFVKNRERWILAAKSSAASIEVDEGAVIALQQGKSLLAVGIKKVYDKFEEGEIVEIIDNSKQGIAFGVVDIASEDLGNDFKFQKGIQVMHADNIMVFA